MFKDELFKKKDALEKKLSGAGQSNIAWKSHGEEYDINEEFEAEAYDLDERFEMFMVDVEYIDEAISPKQIHGSGRTIPKGSTVKFVHNGKIVSGMVVSFNRNVMTRSDEEKSFQLLIAQIFRLPSAVILGE